MPSPYDSCRERSLNKRLEPDQVALKKYREFTGKFLRGDAAESELL